MRLAVCITHITGWRLALVSLAWRCWPGWWTHDSEDPDRVILSTNRASRQLGVDPLPKSRSTLNDSGFENSLILSYPDRDAISFRFAWVVCKRIPSYVVHTEVVCMMQPWRHRTFKGTSSARLCTWNHVKGLRRKTSTTAQAQRFLRQLIIDI